MSNKSPDAFRTISEVADWLGVPTHVLRFWESRFSQVKPVKRAGGRRYYRPADMELLGGIRKLLHEDGMTIRGVQKLLREHGVKHVAAMSPSIDSDELRDVTPSNVVPIDRAEEDTASAPITATDPIEDAEIITEPPKIVAEPMPEPTTEPLVAESISPELPDIPAEPTPPVPETAALAATLESTAPDTALEEIVAEAPVDPIDPIETKPELPDASEIPDATEPAAAAPDISHIPDDPPEGEGEGVSAPNSLLAALRETRAGRIQNRDALGDIAARLNTLKTRMHRERQSERPL